MLGLFKKKDNKVTWNSLTSSLQNNVAKKIISRYKNLARYKVVQGFDTWQRERPTIETYGENHYLPMFRRNYLLDICRNQARNSSTFNTLLRLMQENVIGIKGGKIVCDFQDMPEKSKELYWQFARWTRNCDFYDGLNLNTLLRIVLNNELIGGENVLLFDNGLINGSNKVLIFEPDEIVNTAPDAIEKKYGAGAKQDCGKVYNKYGQFIGVVVSRSSRGMNEADPSNCYFLKKDPNSLDLENDWMMTLCVWRKNQGRGITPFASSIAAVDDLEDLTNFEMQRAKKASQTFAQIYNTREEPETQLPSAFEDGTDFSQMTDAEIEEAVKTSNDTDAQTVSLTQAKSCGILFDQMPDGYRMELLESNSPRENVIEFVKWMAGRTASGMGLSQVFATLAPDSNTFRAEQILTLPTFDYYQKRLEQVLDWMVYRFVIAKNISGLPDHWMHDVQWSWPKMDEVDEEKHLRTIQLQLQNRVVSYKQLLGQDWKQQLIQIRDEAMWMKENGITPPSELMKSGGQTEASVEIPAKTTELK